MPDVDADEAEDAVDDSTSNLEVAAFKRRASTVALKPLSGKEDATLTVLSVLRSCFVLYSSHLSFSMRVLLSERLLRFILVPVLQLSRFVSVDAL